MSKAEKEQKKPYRVTQTGLTGHKVGDVIMLTERGARARVNKVELVDEAGAAKDAEKVAQAQIDAATAEAGEKKPAKAAKPAKKDVEAGE